MDNDYENIEKEMKEDMNKILSGYFKEFLNKFDNFNNQLKVAELLLKAYQYRYDKYKQKFEIVNDIIISNFEEQKEFQLKVEKLNKLEIKMTEIEMKLNKVNQRIEVIENKLIN